MFALRTKILALWVALVLASVSQAGARLKDITQFEGARSNYLTGVGLVVGLGETGGKSRFTQQVATDMLQRYCIGSKTVQDERTDNVFKSGNISVVMVTAELGPYSRKGSTIDVTVSILDDATSLLNGTLIFTPLRGADGIVYATAQGSLALGGFSAKGQAASVQKNQVTVGHISNGALVEEEARGECLICGRVRMLIKNPDHATAEAITHAVNRWLPGNRALALDAGTVQVQVPREYWPHTVAFLGEMGNLEVNPDTPARVVIQERTGTVIAGENVKISTVAIAHGNLSVVTRETPIVSQPEGFSRGRTVRLPRTDINANEESAQVHTVPQTVSVGDLAKALNALGVTPRDLISIFQALKKAGALQAELVPG